MSLPLYKDFDKCTRDLFSDDFDTKYSLKVKSEAPSGVALTTTTDCNCGDGSMSSKVSMKWAHSSGFTVDKLEMAGCNKIKMETSLTGVAPGLKLEFKGASGSGNLGVVYKHAMATVATDIDVVGFSSANASFVGGSNGIVAGANAAFTMAGKFGIKDYGVAIGYNQCCGLFAGVTASNKFTDFSTALKYKVNPSLTVAALVDITPATSTHKFNVATAYKCNADTDIKLKVNNDGVINASVKQQLPKKFVVVGAAEFDTKNLSKMNFGITATLG